MGDAKTGSTLRFLAGAAMFSPLFLAEDLLRKAGADIPQEGIFYNNEGKSILEIFNEHTPEKMAPLEMRQASEVVAEINAALDVYNKEVDLVKAKRSEILQMVASAQAKLR